VLQGEVRRTRTGRRIVIAAASVLVVAAAAIALVVGVGGSDDTTTAETRPVRVVGDALPAYRSPVDDPAVGTKVPELIGQSFDGSAVTVQPGRNTLVVLFGHWKAESRESVQYLVDHYTDPSTHPDYDIVIVSSQVKPDQSPSYPPSALLEEMADPFPFPVLADDEGSSAATALALTTFPLVLFVDAEGALLLRLPVVLDASLMDAADQVFAEGLV
jgi:hypothetical protein